MPEAPGGNHYGPFIAVVLSLAGIVLGALCVLILLPRLKSVPVEKPIIVNKQVEELEFSTKTITIEGKKYEVNVPVKSFRTVPEEAIDVVHVDPTLKEKMWTYCMIGVSGFIFLFGLGTVIAWFYFLIKKQGRPPKLITDMLKFILSSFMGTFVGFMGGSSVGVDRQLNYSKPKVEMGHPLNEGELQVRPVPEAVKPMPAPAPPRKPEPVKPPKG